MKFVNTRPFVDPEVAALKIVDLANEPYFDNRQSRYRAAASSSRSGMPGNYITKPPKAEHEAPEWQAAMQALILVATEGGPTMFARIAVQRTLSRHQQQRTKRAAEGNQKA